MSKQSFADLGVSNAVVNSLRERGIEAPFPIQRQVIEDILEGDDVLVQSPTGSGKTLAFGVPLVDLVQAEDPRPSALILAPTRELASQIVDEMEAICHARALSIAAVYGGVGLQQQARRAARAHIIVACPGRLEDQLQRGAFSLKNVRYLVLDEADRMLDMGFKPAVDRIVRQVDDSRQTLFFSATLEGAAGKLANAYTIDPKTRVNKPSPEKQGKIEHRFIHVSHEAKLETLVGELENPDRGRTLVFVRTKHGADRLVKKLGKRSRQVRAVAMHGNKSQNQRQRALADFEDGRVDTLVATDVAARGIDVADVTHVINFDMPEDQDTFVHRVGRTGRAGADGNGISFVQADQTREFGKIARSLGLHKEWEASGGPVSIHSESHPKKHSRSSSRQGNRSKGQGGNRKRQQNRSRRRNER
ncbi:MAG: DEAD/DEAH box helicase [Solirubrobacterales bacterium]|nr:DEAD/DEAH box helicase [Solirubrobacterales bacterium]